MAKKLYVGNLPYSVNDEELQRFFEQTGSVSSASVIQDRYSGRSKGFGFVEMPNDSEASKAIETLNGHDFGGRKLVVNEARPMEERRPRTNSGDRGGYGGGNYR